MIGADHAIQRRLEHRRLSSLILSQLLLNELAFGNVAHNFSDIRQAFGLRVFRPESVAFRNTHAVKLAVASSRGSNRSFS